MNPEPSPDATEPGTHPQGPFAVETVDPLVYRQAADSPELRAAAAAVPLVPRLEIREARPRRKASRSYSKWTPGGLTADALPAVAAPRRPGRFLLRIVIAVLLTCVPLLVVYGLVQAGVSLYRG